ncbi:unnamed protein product [Cochlearia groenlandica]
MQRRENDRNKGICCRRIRSMVVKLMASQTQDKAVMKKNLIKKESKSDITIYFKQREELSEDNVSRAESTERVIMLVNGSNGTNKMIHQKDKSIASEANSFVRPIARLEDGKSHPKPLLNDINKKSEAFIKSRLEKMRKSL